jgi:hypothetical protein
LDPELWELGLWIPNSQPLGRVEVVRVEVIRVEVVVRVPRATFLVSLTPLTVNLKVNLK